MAGHVRTRTLADGSKRYQARFTDGAREEVQTFARRADAKRWLLDRESALVRGDLLDPSIARLTFADLAADWIATWPGRLQPMTQERNHDLLRLWVLPRFGDQLASRITHRDVQLYLDQLAAGRHRLVKIGPRRKGQPPSASTIRKIHATISAVFTEAVRQGTLRVNPARHCRLPRPARTHAVILSMEEASAFADHLPPPYDLATRLTFSTGLRAGELWALQRRDVDLLHCRLHVERGLKDVGGRLEFGPTKSHATRIVAFPRSLAKAMEAQLATRPPHARTSCLPAHAVARSATACSCSASGAQRHGRSCHPVAARASTTCATLTRACSWRQGTSR